MCAKKPHSPRLPSVAKSADVVTSLMSKHISQVSQHKNSDDSTRLLCALENAGKVKRRAINSIDNNNDSRCPDVEDDSFSSKSESCIDPSSPLHRRTRSVTVTSEEMNEFVSDRYWDEFPKDESF